MYRSIEHLGRSDVSDYMCRALLRDAVAGKTPPDTVRAKGNAASRGKTVPSYCSDTKLSIRRHANDEDEKGGEIIRKAALQVLAVMKECDELPVDERRQHILRCLDEIEANP